MFLSPENRSVANLAKDRLSAHNIQTIAVDLDNTLLDTHTRFEVGIREACLILLCDNDPSRTQEAEELRLTLWNPMATQLSQEFGIDPAGYQYMVYTIAKMQGLSLNDPKIDLALNSLEEIYFRAAPEILPGADECIDVLSETGVQLVLMTHGARKYSEFKLAQTGFLTRFTEMVFFDTRRPKSEQWQGECVKRGIQFCNLLTIGDNFNADILSPVSLGARGIWINTGTQIHDAERKQDIPQDYWQRIYQTPNIAGVVDTILNM